MQICLRNPNNILRMILIKIYQLDITKLMKQLMVNMEIFQVIPPLPYVQPMTLVSNFTV